MAEKKTIVAARRQVAERYNERLKAAREREQKIIEQVALLVAAVDERERADSEAGSAVKRLLDIGLSAASIIEWAGDERIDLAEVRRLKALGKSDASAPESSSRSLKLALDNSAVEEDAAFEPFELRQAA